MIINRATEYTINAVLYLAAQHPIPVTSKREICEAEGITPGVLTKILQPLIKNGLVRSRRGVAGGFSLARAPEKTTLWDVLQAVEEPMALNVCLVGGNECGRVSQCPVHEMWVEAREKMAEIFSKKCLAQIVQERAEGMDALSSKRIFPAMPRIAPIAASPLSWGKCGWALPAK